MTRDFTMNLMKYHIYVDASNLLIEFAKHAGVAINVDKPTELIAKYIFRLVTDHVNSNTSIIERVYWFGSHTCTTEDALNFKKILRSAEFEPILLKRTKGKGEKGVDIAMATEMMACAFNKRCEGSVIVAGDEDYTPVVQEIRRTGHQVIMEFFEKPSSDLLRVECDRFISLDNLGKTVGEWIKKIESKSK